MSACTTGFSLPEVMTLLVTVLGMIGLPVGIQFRAMQSQNRELLDLLRDQIGILKEPWGHQQQDPSPMSFWGLLTAGLRREPKAHMPWLQDMAAKQKEVKAITQDAQQKVKELAALSAEANLIRRLRGQG